MSVVSRRKYRVKSPCLAAVPTPADAEEYYPAPNLSTNICYPSKPSSFTPDSYYPAPQREYLSPPSQTEAHGPDIIPNKKGNFKLKLYFNKALVLINFFCSTLVNSFS